MTATIIVILIIAVMVLAAILLTFFAWMVGRQFLATHESINTQRDLDDFKSVAKGNMYGALAIIVFFGIAFIATGVGLYLGLFGILPVLLACMVVGPICAAAGFMMTACEKKMKTWLPVDPSLREEFDRVISVWEGSPFPDW